MDIMSCSEVMYQAYYPYLYQRAGAAPPVSAHPVPRTGPFSSPFGAAHQYDRFNVQRLHQDAHSLSQPGSSGAAATGVGGLDSHVVSGHTHPLYLQGSAHSSGGSVSSTGGASPTSPLRPGKEEDCSLHGRSSTEDHQQGVDDDDSQDTGSSRAQYVSANCVVFTHYQGDAASVVDEHFSRALDKTSTHTKESSPMSARNFPPSFWNSQHYSGAAGTGHHGASAADLYSEHYHPGDAWYQYSQHHRAVHDYHHHNMAAQYGGLLLPGSRLHMSSHAPCKAMDWQHPSIESPYSSYPTMSGLEAQVQDSSKDLYWF
ncbi:protein vestigial [Anoplophora glabripennis]|uniref:protein vestigial n=2 Tax=Anoplophora glabripennis TaxID=217634 RepID=UPI000873897F|nr:protein vestigial [Anoplophora glabripennis]